MQNSASLEGCDCHVSDHVIPQVGKDADGT
jgi:hypothetical protein